MTHPSSRPVAPTHSDRMHRNCPLCDHNDHKLLRSHDSWDLVRCNRCDLAYLPVVPRPQELTATFEWADSFSRERKRRWFSTPWMRVWTLALAPLVVFVRPSRAQRAIRVVRRHARGGKLLDIGCSDGRFLAAAVRAGFDAIGVELSPVMAARARRRVDPARVFCGRLEDQQLADGSLDVVVTISCLEHDLQTLQHAFNLLRPGALCIHKVPNFASLLPRLLGRRWSGYRWPEHVQYFTPATLTDLCSRAGFEVIETRAPSLGDNFWLVAWRPS